jgi:serine phosphatase RsbU (regulator of sigma subunit)/HAMP domain-containing protein
MNLLNTLKFKILSAKLILCLACLGTSFFFISNLFMREKKTDLFEAGLLRSKLILSEYESKFKIASLLYETHKEGQKMIGGLDGLEEIISCKETVPLEQNFRNHSFSMCPGESALRTANGYFIITFYKNKNGVSYLFKLSQQNRAGLESGVASFSIVDESNQKLIYANTEKALHGEIRGLGNENINFSKEVTLKGEDYLAVSVKSAGLSWRSFLFYKSDVVFQALHQVRVQIISLALLMTGAVLIISLLLSNHLAAPINKLTQLAEAIKEGDFVQRFSGKVYGEFKLLGETFNSMADKIIFFLDEMKEKTRLESEVAVAQLVQSSFFPKTEFVDEKVQIHGFYQPAGECGGDWWTFQNHGDKVYFALGDVTGHGVASSLVTASVHSYSSLWTRFFREHKDDPFEPASILENFNDVIRGAGGNLNMTMFVGCLDKNKKCVTYANASHEQPFLVGSGARDEIKFLEGISGPRLGEVANPEYKQYMEMLDDNTFIVLYSDGYVEGLNEEGKYWGEGRFLRELAKYYTTGKPEGMNDGINAGFKKFAGSSAQVDDLSLLTLFIN